MTEEQEKKLVQAHADVSAMLVDARAEADMYKRWWLAGNKEVARLEEDNAKLTEELNNLRDTGTIVVKPVNGQPVKTCDGCDFKDAPDNQSPCAACVLGGHGSDVNFFKPIANSGEPVQAAVVKLPVFGDESIDEICNEADRLLEETGLRAIFDKVSKENVYIRCDIDGVIASHCIGQETVFVGNAKEKYAKDETRGFLELARIALDKLIANEDGN